MSVEPGAVARLVEQVAREVYADDHLHGLVPGQWAILRYLALAGRAARTDVGIATYLGVSKEAAAAGLAALTRKSLITPLGAAEDVAGSIELTKAGRELLDSDPVHRVTTAVTLLRPTARADLASALQEVYRNLSAR